MEIYGAILLENLNNNCIPLSGATGAKESVLRYPTSPFAGKATQLLITLDIFS